MKKVVLAYSGGLDTSVAVAWLREQFGVEVVTLTVDVGGGSLRSGVEAAELEMMDQGVKDRLATLQDWAVQQAFPTLAEGIDHVYIPLMEGESLCH